MFYKYSSTWTAETTNKQILSYYMSACVAGKIEKIAYLLKQMKHSDRLGPPSIVSHSTFFHLEQLCCRDFGWTVSLKPEKPNPKSKHKQCDDKW